MIYTSSPFNAPKVTGKSINKIKKNEFIERFRQLKDKKLIKMDAGLKNMKDIPVIKEEG